MLVDWLRHCRRRSISRALIPIITSESQRRLDKTLTELYSKATAQGASPEDIKAFAQPAIDKANEFMAKENARRIAEWAEEIEREEARFNQMTFGADLSQALGCFFCIGLAAGVVLTIFLFSISHPWR
jgi:hypothetical protein